MVTVEPTTAGDLIIAYMELSESGCWTWTGSIMPNGYGILPHTVAMGGSKFVHRKAYEMFKGDIPSDMQVDHLCQNKRCVNPSHLEVVTRQENKARQQIRAICCRNGHPLTEENTYWSPIQKGHNLPSRRCRTCLKNNSARRKK